MADNNQTCTNGAAKFLASIFTVLTLASCAVSPAMAVPSTTEVPTTTCPNGSTYEEGLSAFTASANSLGGEFLAVKTFDDGSFVSIWDFRSSDVDPETPFLILVFDPNHCFMTSVWFSQQQVQGSFGVVLANS